MTTDHQLASWKARCLEAEQERSDARRETIAAQMDCLDLLREVQELKLQLAALKMRRKTGKAA